MRAPEKLLLRLEWRVVRRLDGQLQGGHRTAFRGSGLDFAGLRAYVEGDDARHIDLQSQSAPQTDPLILQKAAPKMTP